jgi:hypothetical protein
LGKLVNFRLPRGGQYSAAVDKLYELIAAGTIASIRIDGSRRIPLTVLSAYILTRWDEDAA